MKTQDIPWTIVVASGKGGVGKTQVSVDLARALAEDGHSVAFLDADISTPNAPEALTGPDPDFSDQALADGENLLPVDANGVFVFSQGLHLEHDVAILRDDAWKAEAVLNYVYSVEWPADTEYLIVDSPPGNGSEIQTVLSEVPPDHGFLVTTGALHSARDTRRTHELFTEAGVDHTVIANMRVAAFTPDFAAIEERVQAIDQIGPAKAERIRRIAEDTAADTTVPLHDDGVDLEALIGAPITADIPFTHDDDRRRDAIRDALAAVAQPAVVE